jgi:hypothetical protein
VGAGVIRWREQNRGVGGEGNLAARGEGDRDGRGSQRTRDPRTLGESRRAGGRGCGGGSLHCPLNS